MKFPLFHNAILQKESPIGFGFFGKDRKWERFY
jgi:hypothetical protein